MNLLWDQSIAQGRLYGIAHDGQWLHIGTPEALALAEAALAD
jgi:MurNAc alpha-1-phosphate uridylyltransferase